jgi:uncharacterized protein (TIGR03067 family)
MKLRTSLLVAAALTVGLPTPPQPLVAADKKDAAKTSPDLLQGSWRFTRVIQNGEETPADVYGGAKVTVQKDRLTISLTKKTHTATFRLDPAKKPKQIDLVPADGRFQGKTLNGIYAVRGKILRICWAEPGKDRPAGFDSKADSGHYLMVLERRKP